MIKLVRKIDLLDDQVIVLHANYLAQISGKKIDSLYFRNLNLESEFFWSRNRISISLRNLDIY